MKRRGRGFTLLEILFVLVLLGVLLGLVANTLLLGRLALASSESYAQRLGEVRAAQDFLRQAVQRTLPLQYGTGSTMSVFEGREGYLRFAATLPPNLGGGIQWHIIETIPSGGGKSLRVRFETARSQSWGESQLLLRDIRMLRFAYRGINAQGKRTEWLEQWPWPRRLPQQVRIAVETVGPIRWTPQVIALRLDLSGDLEMP